MMIGSINHTTSYSHSSFRLGHVLRFVFFFSQVTVRKLGIINVSRFHVWTLTCLQHVSKLQGPFPGPCGSFVNCLSGYRSALLPFALKLVTIQVDNHPYPTRCVRWASPSQVLSRPIACCHLSTFLLNRKWMGTAAVSQDRPTSALPQYWTPILRH